MILIVTNRQDHTADFLILELLKRKVEHVRFNTEDFPQYVGVEWHIDTTGTHGHLSFPKRAVDLGEVHSIWYRRPVPPVPSRDISDPAAQEFAQVESQASLEGVLSTLDCFWVSRPDNIRRAENKLLRTENRCTHWVSISLTLVTTIPSSARDFYHAHSQLSISPCAAVGFSVTAGLALFTRI